MPDRRGVGHETRPLVANRGARIRTGDPLLPKQVRYRTAPRPVVRWEGTASGSIGHPGTGPGGAPEPPPQLSVNDSVYVPGCVVPTRSMTKRSWGRMNSGPSEKEISREVAPPGSAPVLAVISPLIE